MKIKLNDRNGWKPNNIKRDRFNTREVYNLLRIQSPQVAWSIEVWFSGRVPKHAFLTWLIVLNRCPTCDRLLSWGIQTDSYCLLCNLSQESRYHIFFDCTYSWTLWEEISLRCNFDSPRDWESLLSYLQPFTSPKQARKLLLIAWQTTLYLIWAERNNRLHSSASKSVDSLHREADLLIGNRIASLRHRNSRIASEMLQLWLSR